MDYICTDCPRRCAAARGPENSGGYCASPSLPRIARAAPHFGEEPCISGERGSGAIFFTGCNLRCVFCQNIEISRGHSGSTVSVEGLREMMLRLRDKGVHNINLVTAGHFVRSVAKALEGLELGIPVVWNSSGYESVEALRMLEGLVQVYMPDYKYAHRQLAKRCSGAEDYPEAAAAAIEEMYRQRGDFVLDDEGMLRSGLLIRHLILPGQLENSMAAIDFVADNYGGGRALFSLMSQYTPMPGAKGVEGLERPVSREENEFLCAYMEASGIEYGFWQDVEASGTEEIPDFDGTGVE